jgi:hypothetical protein
VTVTYVEQWTCDRCGSEFVRRTKDEWNWRTAHIGWFTLNQGNGSRATDPSRDGIRKELDRDMCNKCTEAFELWWKAGKNSG